MNELDMRLESNLLYGDPTRIIAISTNKKNLMQGGEAQPPENNNKSKRNEKRDPLRDLESIFEFSYGTQWKKETTEKQRKRISQGSIPLTKRNHNDICKNKLSILEQVLRLSGLLQ